jgi:hypothetical protein
MFKKKKWLLYHHCCSTLLENTSSERFNKTARDWGTSASGLCWLLIDWAKICYKNTEDLLVAGLETYIYLCPLNRMQDKS